MNLWKVIKILQTESSDVEVFDEELQEDELSGSDCNMQSDTDDRLLYYCRWWSWLVWWCSVCMCICFSPLLCFCLCLSLHPYPLPPLSVSDWLSALSISISLKRMCTPPSPVYINTVPHNKKVVKKTTKQTTINHCVNHLYITYKGNEVQIIHAYHELAVIVSNNTVGKVHFSLCFTFASTVF